MSSNKYYIPSIEEFYVGFEFEERREVWVPDYLGIKVLEYIWEPLVGNLSSLQGNLDLFYEGINPTRKEQHYRFTRTGAYSNMVRVKYLSKEDIESLGWSVNSPSGYNIGSSNINDAFVIVKNGTYFLYFTHFEELPKVCITKQFSKHERNYNETIFDGTIKNKSELKKLLKQLNIN